jgi:hypothetical protein
MTVKRSWKPLSCPQQALLPARMVGMARFELAASCSQSRRANQAAPHPAKPTVAYLSSRILGVRVDPSSRPQGWGSRYATRDGVLTGAGPAASARLAGVAQW